MPYKIKNDPYVYAGTDILRNKLDIQGKEKLEEVEFSITATELAALDEDPVAGNFDLEHLQAIHAQLFDQLYDWAGKLRTVDIEKDGTRFAHVVHLENAAQGLFSQLKQDKWLKGLDKGEFLGKFTHYYSEINVLHPFREGNGRVQRAFFTLLAKYNGYHVAWDQMIQDDNVKASIAAYNGDEESLVEILRPLLEWIDESYFYFKRVDNYRFKIDKKQYDWPK